MSSPIWDGQTGGALNKEARKGRELNEQAANREGEEQAIPQERREKSERVAGDVQKAHRVRRVAVGDS